MASARRGGGVGSKRVSARAEEERARAALLRTSMISRAAGLASSVHHARDGDTWLKAMGKARKALPRGTARLTATAKSAMPPLPPSPPLARPCRRSCCESAKGGNGGVGSEACVV